MHIYVDADACPVKEEVCRVAQRFGAGVTFVANQRMGIPRHAGARLEVVPGGLDVADDWIAERAAEGDVVITSDIPLAARCIAKGAQVLRANGEPFTEDNIGGALASRELLNRLRESGAITGGPAAFTPRDRSRFLHQLDEILNRLKRAHPGA